MKRILLPLFLAVCTLASAQTTTTAQVPPQTVTMQVPGFQLQLPVVPGPPGAPGAACSLSIGTVSALPAGSAPTATITGAAPNLALNLGLPAASASSTTSAIACSGAGAQRLIPATAYVANDTVTKPATAFANTVSTTAGQITTPGQVIQLWDAFDWTAGTTSVQQLQFEIDGNPVGSAVGLYEASATKSPFEWQANVWITVVAAGGNGAIEVHQNYVQQTNSAVVNNMSAGVSTFPSTVTYALDTTKAHTFGFATGTYSFTGSVQQRQPIGIFYP